MTFISSHGQWRIRVLDSVAPDILSNQEIEIHVGGERWVYPDCGWRCSACGCCLGCLRKIVHGFIDVAEPDPCPKTEDGMHVVTDQDDDVDER